MNGVLFLNLIRYNDFLVDRAPDSYALLDRTTYGLDRALCHHIQPFISHNLPDAVPDSKCYSLMLFLEKISGPWDVRELPKHNIRLRYRIYSSLA